MMQYLPNKKAYNDNVFILNFYNDAIQYRSQ